MKAGETPSAANGRGGVGKEGQHSSYRMTDLASYVRSGQMVCHRLFESMGSCSGSALLLVFCPLHVRPVLTIFPLGTWPPPSPQSAKTKEHCSDVPPCTRAAGGADSTAHSHRVSCPWVCCGTCAVLLHADQVVELGNARAQRPLRERQ